MYWNAVRKLLCDIALYHSNQNLNAIVYGWFAVLVENMEIYYDEFTLNRNRLQSYTIA